MDECTTGVETWLPIVGSLGYEVSDWGRVRSLDRCVPVKAYQRNGHYRVDSVKHYAGRLLVAPCDSKGYPRIYLGRGSPGRFVHHLVLETFGMPRPNGSEGCHNDGNSKHNCYSNLRWDTHHSNIMDKRAHGTDHQRNKHMCPRRHLLKMPNLVKSLWNKGRRTCLACARARANQAAAELHGRSFDFESTADHHYMLIMGD